MRWIWITAGLLFLWAALAFGQDFSTGGDPWWRPLSPFGQSYGITVGNTRPTLPRPGELFFDVDDDRIELYDGATWLAAGASVLGSIVFEGATVDDFETTLSVVEPTADQTYQLPNQATGTYTLVFSTLATNALDAANSIWGASNGLVFEGSGVDAFEATLSAQNSTVGDQTFQLPNNAAAATYQLAFSTLTTNALDVVNSVWLVSGGLRFEGATANDFESTLDLADPTVGDQIYRLPDNALAGTYALAFSTLATNALDAASSVWLVSNGLRFEGDADGWEYTIGLSDPTAAVDVTFNLPTNQATGTYVIMNSTFASNAFGTLNSVWGVSNGLTFEGTADDFENILSAMDATVGDQTYQLPNNAAAATYNLMFSTLVTNAFDVANSVWGASDGLVFEGSGADANEGTVRFENPGADVVVQFNGGVDTLFGGTGWLTNTRAILIDPDVPITAAGQTTRCVYVNLTNANHTGGNLNALELALDALDADAVETALRVTGFDRGVWVNDGGTQLVFGTDADVSIGWVDALTRFDISAGGNSVLVTATSGFEWANALATHRLFTSALPAAGASGNLFSLVSTINAMDAAGGDIVNAFIVSLTNANHTGGTLNGLNVSLDLADAQATEVGLTFNNQWDFEIAAASGDPGFALDCGQGGCTFTISDGTTNGWYFAVADDSGPREWNDIAVVGAAQNVDPGGNIGEIGAAAGASVLTITMPTVNANETAMLTFICQNANVTFTDSGAGGAANTIDLAGAADFTCTADDTLTLVAVRAPSAGNARWVEADRSVN